MDETRAAHALPQVPHLIGRSLELDALREVLSANRDTRLVSIEGIGGSGKSALVSALLPTVTFDFVHVWSFYVDRDGDAYLADLHARLTGEALRAGGLGRVDAVVDALRSREDFSALLVLDGLERIQDTEPPHNLAEAAMQLFLESMLDLPAGCRCIVTTRFPLQFPAFIPAERTRRAVRMALRPLDTEASIALLEAGGVRGSAADLASVAAACGGHPLTIRLAAGGILRFLYGDAAGFNLAATDDPLRAQSLPHEERQLLRLMAFYRHHLGDDAARLLERICLFRAPVSFELLERLRIHVPDFIGYEDGFGLRDGLDLLHSCGLVEVTAEGSLAPHAVVRDYFPAPADLTSHATLAGFLSATPGDLWPLGTKAASLVEEVIHHTVLSGEPEQAARVYWKVLGASEKLCEEGDLARGERVVRDLLGGRLSTTWRARLLNDLGIYLDAQGRLSEAAACYRRALRARLRQGDAANASRVMQNMCDNALLRGRLPLAAKLARRAMKSAQSNSENDDAESARLYGHYIHFLRGYVEVAVDSWANIAPAGTGAILGADALLRSGMPHNALAVARRNLEAVEAASDALAHRAQVQVSHALLNIALAENKGPIALRDLLRGEPVAAPSAGEFRPHATWRHGLTQAIAWGRRTGSRALLIEALLVQGQILEACSRGEGRAALDEALQLAMRHEMRILEVDARRIVFEDRESVEKLVSDPRFDYRWEPREAPPAHPPLEHSTPAESLTRTPPETPLPPDLSAAEAALLERQLLEFPTAANGHDLSSTIAVPVGRGCVLLMPVDPAFAAEVALLRQASDRILGKMLAAMWERHRVAYNAAPTQVATSWHVIALLLLMGARSVVEQYADVLPDVLADDVNMCPMLAPLARGIAAALTDFDRAARLLDHGLLTISPENRQVAAVTAFNLGTILEWCGRARAARDAFERCLRWDPTFAAALDHLREADARTEQRARCHGSMQQVADALEASRRYHAGEYPPTLLALSHERLVGAPTCPTDARPYTYRVSRRRFLLACALHRVRRDSTLGDLTPLDRSPVRAAVDDPFVHRVRRIFDSWDIAHKIRVSRPDEGRIG